MHVVLARKVNPLFKLERVSVYANNRLRAWSLCGEDGARKR